MHYKMSDADENEFSDIYQKLHDSDRKRAYTQTYTIYGYTFSCCRVRKSIYSCIANVLRSTCRKYFQCLGIL